MNGTGFAGRVAVVTGGASGIGLATAEHLADLGAHVVVADRNGTAAEIAARRMRGTAFEIDVRDAAAVEAFAAEVEATVGPVEAVVTSAGVVQPPHPPETLDLALYDSVYEINLRGTYLTLKALAGPMIARGRGAMVTISSVTAERSVPLHAYAPMKAAVSNLTMGLAAEWGRSGLRVNSVLPGYTRTPALQQQIDDGFRDPALLAEASTLGRMVETAEVANAVAFLLSDAASGITGVNLPVDAGFFCAGSWAPYGGVRPARSPGAAEPSQPQPQSQSPGTAGAAGATTNQPASPRGPGQPNG